jgi:hypothetical protein
MSPGPEKDAASGTEPTKEQENAPGSRVQKLLDQMRRTKSGWKPGDFERLYTGFDFVRREGGEHTVYSHPVHKDLRATVARHSSLATGYAATALRIVDELLRRQSPDADQKEEDEGATDEQNT